MQTTITDAGKYLATRFEARDCGVRSLALAAGATYLEAHAALKAQGRHNRRGTKVKIIPAAARILGVKMTQVKRSGTVGKLAQAFPDATLVVYVSDHITALINGQAFDMLPVSPLRRVIKAWIIQPMAA